jgi:hypothetical protein
MNLRGGDPKELGKDLLRAFNKVGYDYNKMLDDLNNMPDKPPFVQVMGKAAAMTIPIAMFLGATLAPEIGIGMFMGDNLAIILTNVAVGQFWSFAANKVMDKAEVDNPIARIGVDLLVGTAATSGALDVRGIYRLGFHRSAKIAESRVDGFLKNFDNYVEYKVVSGKTVEKIESEKNTILNNLEKADRIVFTLGGAGDVKQYQAKIMAATLNRVKDPNLEKTTFFPFMDRKIFPPDLTQEDTELTALGKGGREYFKSTLKNFYNEDAISLAVQVAALKKKYPDKEVSLVGYCGGGLVAREASEILKIMGIKTKNNTTIATPFVGMTSAQNFTNIISDNDVYSNFLRPRDNFYLDTVADHIKYFEDPFFKQMFAEILRGKAVDTKGLQLYDDFTKITKECNIAYIHKKLNIFHDDLRQVASNFFDKEIEIDPDNYIKTIKKIDKGIKDVFENNKQVTKKLGEMESKLMNDQETDEKTLALFIKLRTGHEKGIESFIENTYKQRYLKLEYKKFFDDFDREIKKNIDPKSELGKKFISDSEEKMRSIKDYLKKIDEVVSNQGEESYLGLAVYSKNKLEAELINAETRLKFYINPPSWAKRK